jgi:hypothetical protein
MDSDQKNKSKNNNAKQHASVIPATEIARNPNPRANENIRDRSTPDPGKETGNKSGVGSEITDGEDA